MIYIPDRREDPREGYNRRQMERVYGIPIRVGDVFAVQWNNLEGVIRVEQIQAVGNLPDGHLYMSSPTRE